MNHGKSCNFHAPVGFSPDDMKNSKLLLIAILTGILSPLLLARGPGGTDTRRPQGNPACPNPGQNCDGTGPLCVVGLCTGSGPCSGSLIPLKDGSGKASANRGNPNSTGTPLRDGSGKASAPGKGAKDGSGNNANCPNAQPKS